MKNKKIISILLAVFMAVGFGCSANNQDGELDDNNPSVETGSENLSPDEEDKNSEEKPEKDKVEEEDIGLKKAKEIAIKESGSTDGIIVEYERDFDYGNLDKYEIKVQLDSMEFEIDIDGKTGEVIEMEKQTSDYTLDSYSDYIGLEKAEEIAMNEAGSGYFLKEFELEDHDDLDEDSYYEIELRDESGKKKIKVNIDAKTGNIIK